MKLIYNYVSVIKYLEYWCINAAVVLVLMQIMPQWFWTWRNADVELMIIVTEGPAFSSGLLFISSLDTLQLLDICSAIVGHMVYNYWLAICSTIVDPMVYNFWPPFIWGKCPLYFLPNGNSAGGGNFRFSAQSFTFHR